MDEMSEYLKKSLKASSCSNLTQFKKRGRTHTYFIGGDGVVYVKIPFFNHECVQTKTCIEPYANFSDAEFYLKQMGHI